MNKADYRSRQMAREFTEALNEIESSAIELAGMGWTMPMSITPGEVHELLQGGELRAIEKCFVQLYEARNQEHFVEITGQTTKRKCIERWIQLLEEAISAYERRQFTITIPALVSVCEGLLMNNQGRSTEIKRVVKERVYRVEQEFPASFTLIVWRTVQRFIDELFKYSSFEGPHPGGLNRHWILHGRDAATWTQADSLRLFQAVDTISALVELSKIR